MLKQNLNLDIGVRNLERKVFTEALNKKEIILSLIPYRYDYVDASNQLTLWLSSGRHPWQNNLFESLVNEANFLVGNPGRRTQLYQEAEKILVSEVGGVFLWYTILNELWQPYVRGAAVEKNKWGTRAWRGNQMMNMTPTLYISNEVLKMNTTLKRTSFWDWLTGK
jgi:ABC-type oligopeptide transport system substrate-binding subunit